MELRKSIDFRRIAACIYAVCFAVYLLVGLQPVAEAANYEASAELVIPSIGLTADVTSLELKGKRLETPAVMVGSFARAENKTLLIGHASTVFSNLKDVMIGDELVYNGNFYKVFAIETLAKDEINMNEILASAEEDTLVLMTCAGKLFGDGDASHRLIVMAEAL